MFWASGKSEDDRCGSVISKKSETFYFKGGRSLCFPEKLYQYWMPCILELSSWPNFNIFLFWEKKISLNLKTGIQASLYCRKECPSNDQKSSRWLKGILPQGPQDGTVSPEYIPWTWPLEPVRKRFDWVVIKVGTIYTYSFVAQE